MGIMDLIEADLQNETKFETDPNTGSSLRDFDEKPIQEISNKVEDQAQTQSIFEGVKYAYDLYKGEHFVMPEFVLPEELDIKVESQEMGLPNTEEFLNFSLETYVKPESTTSESEAGKPLNHQQNSGDKVKKESFAETEFLMQREVDIKSEDEESDQSNTKSAKGETEKSYHPSSKTGLLTDLNQTDTKSGLLHQVEPPVFKCLNCSYQTHRKRNLSRHVRNHNEMTFTCSHCSYKTWNSSSLKHHQLVHASKEEVELHKCPECPFTTKWKRAVTNHLLVHKNLNEVTWYKCPECPFRTKHKGNLTTTHMLLHRKDTPIYKCILCSYESCRKQSLRQHFKYVHEPKDIELFGCPEEGCLFTTRCKSSLASHIRKIHKIFKCSICVFQTKYATNLKAHELGHENPDKWYSCSLCPYKTPNRSSLNRHALIHKGDSEIKWFQCSECSFKTKYKYHINQHKLTHNEVLEKQFECSDCCYKTAIASYYRRHLLKHKNPDT